MFRLVTRAALTLACGVGLAGPAAAQPAPPASDPAPSPPVLDRSGSAVATLEALTGERATDPAPEGDEIETDRDSFTPATSVTGRGRLVTETSYSFLDNRGIKETHSLPELLLRYGVTDRLEVRLGWNYEVGGAGNEAAGVGAADEELAPTRARLVREHTLLYGWKFLVSRRDGWVPQSALIVQGFTPTGGGAGATTATQLVTTYAAGWRLPNRWKLDGAIRYGTASEDGDRYNQWAPSVVVRVPVGEAWAAHAEYFGLVTTGRERNATRHYFSPGLHYLVTPDLEVGFRLGWGLNDQSARFFSNVGLGCRF